MEVHLQGVVGICAFTVAQELVTTLSRELILVRMVVAVVAFQAEMVEILFPVRSAIEIRDKVPKVMNNC